jgi:hypothetical protein
MRPPKQRVSIPSLKVIGTLIVVRSEIIEKAVLKNISIKGTQTVD